MAVFEVSTVAGLNAALLSARGGDTISLAPGTYDGTVFINARDFDPPLTIRSADPDDPATFSARMLIKNSTGISLEDVDFRLGANEPASWLAQVHLVGSENISLTGVTIEGRLARPGEGAAPESLVSGFANTTLIEGYAFGDGVTVRGSANVSLNDVEITKVAQGVGIVDSDDVSITDSHLHNLRRDGIVIVGSNDVSITSNLIDSFHPFVSTSNLTTADHPDFIQYHNSFGTRGIDSLTISQNAFLQGDGAILQGIFGRLLPKPEGVEQVAYTNFVITDNVINTAHRNTLNLGDVSSAVVTGNILIPAPLDLSVNQSTVPFTSINLSSDGPRTEDGLRDYAAGAVRPETLIADNLYVLRTETSELLIVGVPEDARAENGVTIEGNTVLSIDPGSSNWFGTLFPDLVDRPVTDLAALLAASPVGPSALAPWIIEEAAKLTGLTPGEQRGGSGDDILVAGDDGGKLAGGAGDDLLLGGDHMDTLYGQAGSDTMTGGARGDLFNLTMSAPGTVDEDVITDLDFGEGDVILFGEGFPAFSFRDDIDIDNKFETWNSGSRAIVNSDADIEELLATTFASLGDAAPGDVRLDFDFDRDGAVDYRLLLKGYGVAFTDRNVEPLFASPQPKPQVPVSFDFGAVLPLYSNLTTVKVNDKSSVIFAGADGTLLMGANGNDSLLGGASNDVFIGGAGSDTMFLGGGADRVLLDVSLVGDEDIIVDLKFEEGDVVEFFFPGATALPALSHAQPGTVANSVVVNSVAGLIELLDKGLAEVAVGAQSVRFVFPPAAQNAFALTLFDFGEGPIRAALEARDSSGPPLDQILALPDFAGGESLLIEGMPSGYFTGSGLVAPTGVTDGSAVVIASTQDIRTLLLSVPGVDPVPLGDDRIELRLTDGGVRIVSVTLTDLGEVSAYKLAFGDPGGVTRTGTDGNDRILTYAGDDVLNGGAGDDFLRGAWDDDWLDGGAGDDTLVLDYGDDVAIGGAGADTFQIFGDFIHDGDHDIIADLNFAEGDKIAFSRFAYLTFDADVFKGTTKIVSSVEDLAGMESYGFELERISRDAVLLRFETAKGANTLEIYLDQAELARFDELFAG